MGVRRRGKKREEKAAVWELHGLGWTWPLYTYIADDRWWAGQVIHTALKKDSSRRRSDTQNSQGSARGWLLVWIRAYFSYSACIISCCFLAAAHIQKYKY